MNQNEFDALVEASAKKLHEMSQTQSDVTAYDPEYKFLEQFAVLPTDPKEWTVEMWRRWSGLMNLRTSEMERRFKQFLKEYKEDMQMLLSTLSALSDVADEESQSRDLQGTLQLQSQSAPAEPAGDAANRLDDARKTIESGAFVPGLGGRQ